MNGRVPLPIELKNSRKSGPPKTDPLGEAVIEALEGYEGRYALQSFDPGMVLWLRRYASETPRGQLAGDFRAEGVPLWKSLLIERRLYDLLATPDFFGCGTERLHTRAVAARRRAGTPVPGWTVRSSEEEKRALRFCDNVIFEGYIPKGAPATTRSIDNQDMFPGR